LNSKKTLEETGTYDRTKIAAELTVKRDLVEEKLWNEEEYFNYYKVNSQWLKDLQTLGIIHTKPQELNINNREDTLNKFYEKLNTGDLEELLTILQQLDAADESGASDKFAKIDISTKKRH